MAQTRAPEKQAAATARILDAARECFIELGTRRTAMTQVAERARVGVATVYRRFPTKAELIRATVLRDAMAVMAEVAIATESAGSAETTVIDGFVAFAVGVQQRPLLREVARGDADLIASIGADDGWAPILALGRTFLADLLGTLQERGELEVFDSAQVAEIFARLALSLVLVPGGVIPLDDQQAMRNFALHHLVSLLYPR
ncbi:MAG: TetR/AcrR family transcriptional regulator [Aeromicrobium sp.]